jgi:hypothetical protein
VRRAWIALIGLVVLAMFFAVSAILARVFSLDGAESSAITALVKDEAAGNKNAAVSQIVGCAHRPACRASVAGNVAALARPGAVSIIQIQPSAGFSLSSTVGTARVAWRVGFSLPIVQCVRVRRAGDAITGFQVQLLAVTRRIHTDADCPSRF